VLQADLIERKCPDCERPLKPDAKACRCGWKGKDTDPDKRAAHVPCDGLPDCTNSATIRIGENNVCRRCYPTEEPRLRKLANAKQLDSPAVRAGLEAFKRSRWKRRASEVGVDQARAELGACPLPRED